MLNAGTTLKTQPKLWTVGESSPLPPLVRHVDCRVGSLSLADNSVSLVLTDPPYFIDGMGSDWDAARMTNAPGQSGDPRSPFYDNLLEGWARDESFPLLFSRDAVEANARLRIALVPAASESRNAR